jgi:hypothetical protein
MSETPEQAAQNSKFGYKAPESVYQKHDPNKTLVGSGTCSRSLGDGSNISHFSSRQSFHRCQSDGLLPSPNRPEEG